MAGLLSLENTDLSSCNYGVNISWFSIGVISVLKVSVCWCVQISLRMGLSSELLYDSNFHFHSHIINNGDHECEAPTVVLSLWQLTAKPFH